MGGSLGFDVTFRAQKGVFVTHVDADGAAFRAQIRPGQKLHSLGGVDIDSTDDGSAIDSLHDAVQASLSQIASGTSVKCVVLRPAALE